MFNWLFANKTRVTPISRLASTNRDLAVKANIADKLKHYKANEDTAISDFSLADDELGEKTAHKMVLAGNYDVWGQANPSETGKWYKEGRRKRVRTPLGTG